MKFIIFIADAIRHGNFPRVDQFEYSPEHGLYIYLGRELTVSEFNEASKRVFDPDFRNQGFLFRPQAVGPAVDAEIQAEAEAAEALRIANAEAEAQRLADEAKAAEELKVEEPPVVAPEWTAPEPGSEYVVAVDVVAVPVGEPLESPTPGVIEFPVNTDPAEQVPEPEAEPSKFRLEGKGIFVGEERVAGLFGEAKQLRVLAAHDALRPEIEAWLQTLTPSDQ